MSALNDLMVAVADSIRAKEGSTDKIAPVDFPQRIDNLQVGGGTSGSNIEYLDVSGLEIKIGGPLWQLAYLRKGYSGVNGFDIITTTWPQESESDVKKAVMLSFSDIVMETKEIGYTIPQYCALLGITQDQLDAIPRITKEQFYDLSN